MKGLAVAIGALVIYVAMVFVVLAAAQWVLEHKDEYNIRVANLSLNSSTFQSYHHTTRLAAGHGLDVLLRDLVYRVEQLLSSEHAGLNRDTLAAARFFDERRHSE